MDKIFKCLPFNNSEMIKLDNRMATEVRFMGGDNRSYERIFILDTGAIVSTMSKAIAISCDIYDKDVVNHSAVVGGFNKKPIQGRIVRVSHLYIARAGVRNVLFFIPDDGNLDIASVLGAGVLNGLVPIPDFDKGLIWIYKNTNVPEPYYSPSLAVSIPCEVLTQEEMPYGMT